MSSVDSKRNKMQLLADCILFLLMERGRMPDSQKNHRFFWRALRSKSAIFLAALQIRL